MKTVRFFTLGCKVNQYDTQGIRERFLGCGFKEADNGEVADIYIINTCTVTSEADQKSKNIIRRCIRTNPKARVIVTGCLVEKDSVSLSDIKGIDFIISKRFFPEGISDFSGHTRAFLKIQDGCNNFCSYCKVPLVRGSSRSKALDKIIQEARALVENGFKEIVLSGICLGSYGKDLKSQTKNLVDVISALENIEGLLRIRLSSIEAVDISNELIKKIANSRRLCRHLHIPLQSGDDKILEDMQRKYSRKDYLNLIQKIKNRIPDIAVTTDCLVGFPTEDEFNFKNTLDLIKEISPLKVHIFSYSPRPGTQAFNFRQRLNPHTLMLRVSQLKAVADSCNFTYRKQFVNKNMVVLIEAPYKESQGFWQGYTDNYIKVRVSSNQNLKNQLICLKLKQVDKDSVLGEKNEG